MAARRWVHIHTDCDDDRGTMPHDLSIYLSETVPAALLSRRVATRFLGFALAPICRRLFRLGPSEVMVLIRVGVRLLTDQLN